MAKLTIGLKKGLNGKAPSREKAHICREAAIVIEYPIRYWTMNRKAMKPMAPFFPRAS